MHEAIQAVVEAAVHGEDSSREAVEAAFAALMDGQVDPIDIAALLGHADPQPPPTIAGHLRNGR